MRVRALVPALDQPLSAIRINYVDTVFNKPRIVWDPITVVPHWSWRGDADYGTLADGGLKTCRTEDVTRCAWRVWNTQGFMYAQQPSTWENGWWGTLLRLKEDATGTQYRRNRYVDPATGRFTQEDPIGLAGGLNLYGFAAGDPVTFSDPFGLCPPKDDTPCPEPANPVKFIGATGAFVFVMGGSVGAGIYCEANGCGVYGRFQAEGGLSVFGGVEAGVSNSPDAFNGPGVGPSVGVGPVVVSHTENEKGSTNSAALGAGPRWGSARLGKLPVRGSASPWAGGATITSKPSQGLRMILLAQCSYSAITCNLAR